MAFPFGYGFGYFRPNGKKDWKPAKLRQSGDILLWYDPSDLTTMFTDTTGTTQVTADGDSVALMLDKGQWGGKTLGQVLAAQPELVSNGGFDTDLTGWSTAGSTAGYEPTWDNGTVEIVRDGSGSGRITQANVLEVGKQYRLSGFTSSNAGSLLIVNSISTPIASNSGEFSVLFAATTTGLEIRTSSSSITNLDNISIKEIPGYHRVQATGTSMPKYKTGPNPAAAATSSELRGTGTVGLVGTATAATYDTGTGVGSATRVTFPTDQSYVVIPVISGRSYALDVTGPIFGLAVRPSPAGAYYHLLGATRTTVVFTAVSNDLMFMPNTNSTQSFTIHSLKEIPASAPYIHWLLYDGADDGHAAPTIPFNTVTSDGAVRRNLLTEPDKFDHTTWTKITGSTVTANQETAPDGTQTADLVTGGSSSSSTRIVQGLSLPTATTYTYSIYVKAGTASQTALRILNAVPAVVSSLDLTWAAGVPALSGGATNAAVTGVGNGWYRVSGSYTTIAAETHSVAYYSDTTGSNGNSYIWGAQLELGSTATDFQNIGTDEVAVCAGVTKSSDAAARVFAELSASSSANTGTFGLFAPSTAATNYQFRSKGSTDRTVTLSPYSSPTTNVLTAQGDISADGADVRVDGVLDAGMPFGAAGTGNFGSYPLYFGRRGGTSFPFSGREYQTVIRSRLLSASELAKLETFVAAKTGVVL